MTEPGAGEPKPIWPDLKRAMPSKPFPPYRFVPGVNPHPVRDPEGHSYGLHEPPRDAVPQERWRDDEDHLFAVDLYHNGFFWEAHEVWEAVWRTAPSGGPQWLFVQGLIMLAAGQLKLHMGNRRAALHLTRNAIDRISRAGVAGHESYMGVDVRRLLAGLTAYEAALAGPGESLPKAPAIMLG